MWIVRLVVANLIARLLWPLVWGSVAVLVAWFVVTVPARLWLLYVDPRADPATLMALNWVIGIGLAAAWLVPTGRRLRRR